MKTDSLLTLIAIGTLGTAAADTFTVKNTNPNGVDSFAQAIVDANAHINTDADTPDRIEFAIPRPSSIRSSSTATPRGATLAQRATTPSQTPSPSAITPSSSSN